MPVDFNVLLSYLSYRETDSWENFKSFIDKIDYDDLNNEFKHYNTRLTLSRLGHVEFLFREKQRFWAICKPSISIIPNTYLGVLSGYRTNDFVLKLKEYCKELEIEFIQEKNYSAPDRITINFNEQPKIETFKIENSLNIEITENFSEKILFLTKNITDLLKNLEKHEGNPENLNLKYFYIDKERNFYSYKKEIIRSNYQEGLYRNDHRFNKSNYLYLNDNLYLVDEETGKFIAFYNNGVDNLIKYKNGNIEISRYIRFPELIDRALIMFSGFNSIIKNKNFVYSNINIKFAQSLANKLGQKLEV